MTLQDLINKRESLDNVQLTSLVDLIGFRQRKEVKRKIKEVLNNKFYTLFDETIFANKFEIKQTEVIYTSKDRAKELNALRVLIMTM